MGWCSGTEVFDPVARNILTWHNHGFFTEDTAYSLLCDLVRALQEQDWDCEEESALKEEPLIQHVFITMGVFEGPDEPSNMEPPTSDCGCKFCSAYNGELDNCGFVARPSCICECGCEEGIGEEE